MFGVLHFFADDANPDAVVGQLVNALAPGSYLAISHLASDVYGESLSETFDRLNSHMSESVILRNQSQVARFFADLELVDPGVVQLPQWHPDQVADTTSSARPLPMWCAVGRKS